MDGRTCNIKQKCVKSQTPRQAKRGRDTKIPQSGGPPEKVGDEAIHKELGDRMERAATTASSSGPRLKLSTVVDIRLHLQVWMSGHGGAATTVTSLDTGQGSGNINKAPSMPYDLPLPRGHTLGSDEGRMQQHELMDLVTKCRLINYTAQGEAHTQQDQPEDHLRVLSAAKVLADTARKRREVVNVQSYTRRRRAVSTGNGEINTAEESVSTTGVSMPFSAAGMVQEASTLSSVATKDKGKAIMQEFKSPKQMKQKEQIQISRDEEVALKLRE
ncbi:hypothetical protein Tco_0256155 [Tanacetum coccineum]